MKLKNINWSRIILIAIIVVPIIVVSLTTEKRGYSQNETVTYEGADYRITSVTKDDEYLTVVIKIKNNSDEAVSYSNMHFVMLDPKGNTIENLGGLFKEEENMLSSGDIAPGEEIEGKVAWKTAGKNKNLRIRYYENIIQSKIDDYKFEWSLD